MLSWTAWIGAWAGRSSGGADGLPMPAHKGGGLDDHETVQQLWLLHPHTQEQPRQSLRPAEPRTLSQLVSQDGNLLAEGQDLSSRSSRSSLETSEAGRESNTTSRCQNMPGRMTGAGGEVNHASGRP